MNPDALPDNLRRRILVCDAPHPRLGTPCWILAAPRAGDHPLPRCGWGRCCQPEHFDPASFTFNRIQPATEGVQAHA